MLSTRGYNQQSKIEYSNSKDPVHTSLTNLDITALTARESHNSSMISLNLQEPTPIHQSSTNDALKIYRQRLSSVKNKNAISSVKASFQQQNQEKNYLAQLIANRNNLILIPNKLRRLSPFSRGILQSKQNNQFCTTRNRPSYGEGINTQSQRFI